MMPKYTVINISVQTVKT